MKGARILVVDDEADVLDFLKAVLEEQGWEVVTTQSAIEAESFIAGAAIDLALLDIGVHGLRLGRKAMSIGKPFILMSGMPVVIEMGEPGAVLRKPFSIAEVHRVVARNLERSRREGRAAAGAA